MVVLISQVAASGNASMIVGGGYVASRYASYKIATGFGLAAEIGKRQGIGTITPVPMPKDGPVAAKSPDGEPRLIKGLDGKEGLDLGNATMKMPDGSVRSITRSGLEIPDLSPGGLSGGGSRADMQAAADRMHAAAERFENASFHGQIDITGLRRSGVRATAVRVRSRGGLTADMGISEPGAKEDLSDRT